MHITIRPAGPEDYPAVISLIREFASFQGTPEKVTITAGQMISDGHLFQCFIAEADKKLVGFASHFYAYYSWTGRAVYLDDLYVQPEYRKKGIGTKLIRAVIDHAQSAGCKKVRWQVSRWNAAAISFYQSLGATIDEVEINCDFVLKD